jgi:alkylation response protein AidB-like acyl-CoA dehydrogenase
LSVIPVAALQAELARRQGQLGSLIKEHDDVSRRLDAVRAEIEALGGTVNGTASRGLRGGPRRGRSASGARRRRKYPRNATNLGEALAAALKGKQMSVTEAAEAVQKAGYKSTSRNFRVIVNQHLLKSPFKRVGRGVYTVK